MKSKFKIQNYCRKLAINKQEKIEYYSYSFIHSGKEAFNHDPDQSEKKRRKLDFGKKKGKNEEIKKQRNKLDAIELI